MSLGTLGYICYTHFFVNSENLVQLCVLANASFSTREAETEDCSKFKATVRTCLQQTNEYTENYR